MAQSVFCATVVLQTGCVKNLFTARPIRNCFCYLLYTTLQVQRHVYRHCSYNLHIGIRSFVLSDSTSALATCHMHTVALKKQTCRISLRACTEISKSVGWRNFSDDTDDVPGEREDGVDSVVLDSDVQEYNQWRQEVLQAADCHAVLIVQPYIKWGPRRKQNTTPDLQLAESVALVQSLKGWQVVEKMSIGLKSFEGRTLFGSGNVNMLKEKLQKSKMITAIFINTGMLKGRQHSELQNVLGVPVYDRYTIIIQVFRQHAITNVAKLQVSMAEIPYLRSRLRIIKEGTVDHRGSAPSTIGGAGESYMEVRKRLLLNHEMKLKQALEKLRNHRQLLRSKRLKLEYPIVAVVGYTNAGKTSLIKALTGDEDMNPENRLFATLDVTNHLGVLPCRLKVLYVDTVGFISDIPTTLLESFVATLEDAMLADVILHVKDLSHPDILAQSENVMATLKGFNLRENLLENIVVAGNKVDLVGECFPDADCLPVSAVTHTGLHNLQLKIQESILRITGRREMIIRVPMGGKEARWLYKEAAVMETEGDPKDSQFLLMHVVISAAKLSRFQHYFIKSARKSASKE